jgi:lysophospholipase L1-like esterase
MVDRKEFIKGAISSAFALSGIRLDVFSNDSTGLDRLSGFKALKNGSIILFQGDSITDSRRGREGENQNSLLGDGYAALSASRILRDFPERNLAFYNRGISGRRLYQLHDIWQTDCIDLKPDILSILIGVNDFHERVTGDVNNRTVETFENDYRILLKRTKEALPNIKIIIGEPYGVAKTRVVNELWPSYEFDKYRKVAKKTAEEFNAIFVPFHSVFENAASEYGNPVYWSHDGIHPTIAGAQLMADTWVEALRKIV